MKYNSEDILHQSFEKKFRGYDPEQVHEFLQSMAREWDFFCSEITRLQDIAEEQGGELRDLRRRERGLLDALNTARELADEMEKKAASRSANILNEAQQRADKLIQSAQRQQTRLLSEIQELQRQRGRLDRELRSVLETHLRLLDEDQAAHRAEAEEVERPTPEARNAAEQGPTIHRRPRTQPPQRITTHPVDEDDIEEEYEDEEDVHEHETLVAVVPHMVNE